MAQHALMASVTVDPATPVPAGSLTAGDVMTTEVVWLTENDSVAAAWELLARGDFHHLPVVRGGCYVGVLDDRTLLRAWRPGVLTRVRRTIGELLGPEVPPGVAASASVAEVARILAERGLDFAAVVDDEGRLLGVVTACDLVRVLAAQPG